MRKVILRMNEQYKYEVIKKLYDNNGNKKAVAFKLNISVRQVNRLLIKYKERGKSAFIHGNRSKSPNNKLDISLSSKIITLYETKFKGFNYYHFNDMLKKEYDINVSSSYIYKTLMKNDLLSPRARKITKRKYVKKQLLEKKKLNDKTEDEINEIIDNTISLEFSHPRMPKPKNFGEIIEMDGSIHNWFGDNKSCLHLAIDKTTNTVVGAYFDYQETLNGYYNVFKQILTDYGVPYMFHTDNRTVFNYNKLNPDKRTSDKDVLTQFGYACKTLGTSIETSSVAEFKALVERDNGTFQGRLVNEFKYYNITTIEEANKYLKDVFIPFFNDRFSTDYKAFDNVFEHSPSQEMINNTLAIITKRKIDKGNSIKYKNKYYQPYNNNKMVCFRAKTDCMVIKTFDNKLLVSIDEQIYNMIEIPKYESFSNNFDTKHEIKKEKARYIPPMSHPWKLTSYNSYLNKSKNIYNYT